MKKQFLSKAGVILLAAGILCASGCGGGGSSSGGLVVESNTQPAETEVVTAASTSRNVTMTSAIDIGDLAADTETTTTTAETTITTTTAEETTTTTEATKPVSTNLSADTTVDAGLSGGVCNFVTGAIEFSYGRRLIKMKLPSENFTIDIAFVFDNHDFLMREEVRVYIDNPEWDLAHVLRTMGSQYVSLDFTERPDEGYFVKEIPAEDVGEDYYTFKKAYAQVYNLINFYNNLMGYMPEAVAEEHYKLYAEYATVPKFSSNKTSDGVFSKKTEEEGIKLLIRSTAVINPEDIPDDPDIVEGLKYIDDPEVDIKLKIDTVPYDCEYQNNDKYIDELTNTCVWEYDIYVTEDVDFKSFIISLDGEEYVLKKSEIHHRLGA